MLIKCVNIEIECLHKSFKDLLLNMLERQCIYKSYLGRTFLFDRLLLAYVMIPIMQREVNTFVDVVWNCHRIREERDTFLPDGVPNHIYSFSDKYGLEDCGRYLSNFFPQGSTFDQCQDSK